jgi:hypothetical protein
MKETVFKVGDKVYCVIYGWGKVTDISTVGAFPLEVTFHYEDDGESTERYYSLDGRWNKPSQPTLSFTEYTLNGFSQERPIELPELGEEIMVSDDGKIWEIGRFREYIPQYKCPVEVERNGDKYSYSYFKRLR